MIDLEKMTVMELPTPLINFLGREFGFDVSDIKRSASNALSKVNWERASGLELLSYADLMYTKGTVFQCMSESSVRITIENGNKFINYGSIGVDYPNGWAIFDSQNKVWAKIINNDPDAEIKKTAKELIAKYVKGTACSGKGGVNTPYRITDYQFENNGLEEMLVEMAKKSQK